MSNDCFFIDNADQRADTCILTRCLNTECFEVLFGNVIGIRIKRFEHSLNSRLSEFLGFYFIYVVGVDFLEESSENIEALGNVEVFLTGSFESKEENRDERER